MIYYCKETIIQNIKIRTDEQVLDSMNKYIKYFKNLMESDSEKVNETDFTRRPKLNREKRN